MFVWGLIHVHDWIKKVTQMHCRFTDVAKQQQTRHLTNGV